MRLRALVDRRFTAGEARLALPALGIEGSQQLGGLWSLGGYAALVDVDQWSRDGAQGELGAALALAVLGAPLADPWAPGRSAAAAGPRGWTWSASFGPWARLSRYRTTPGGRRLERWGVRPSTQLEWRHRGLVVAARVGADGESRSDGLHWLWRLRERLAFEPDQRLRVGIEHEHAAAVPAPNPGRTLAFRPWDAAGSRIGIFAEATW